MFDVNRDRTLQVQSSNRYTGFQNLMRQRVNDILLVSSLYDSFILAQDGQLQELILSEFMELNLYHTPGLTRVAKASEALGMLRSDPRFNLIITTANVGDMHVADFARRVQEAGVVAPIVMLAYDNRELQEIVRHGNDKLFDRLFIWQGDVRVLLAITKQIEDRMNADHDTRVMGVQVILLVEDNIRFYSAYLPLIYAELVNQNQSLLEDGMNMAHKILRMRARPKILLCTTFEEAWEAYRRYKDHLLGVITDIEYSRGGQKDPEAGAELVRRIREQRDDIPILLQSFRQKTAEIAEGLGVQFVRKDSPTLLHELRDFMMQHFSFGDFVFRLPDGRSIDRAHDLRSLEEKLKTVPEESLIYHGQRDHFSNWLKARTEFGLAEKLKPRKVEDFDSVEELRQDLITALQDFRRERTRGVVSDFRAEAFDPAVTFARIGSGSMGGKARGLAFLAHLIDHFELHDQFEGVRVSVPATVVLCTDVYDDFLEQNDLSSFALEEEDEEAIEARFLEARLPERVRDKLAQLLQHLKAPLAVRSSGLLEDSHYQPFAGIYRTYMLPNNADNLGDRLDALEQAVKRVYASTFSKKARAYMEATPYRLEEEKMAVIVQQLVGHRHEDRFYPDVAGVARSYNFYPTEPATSSDGIVIAGLGLGTYVVEGGEGVRFCPRYPKHSSQFATVEDTLDYSQRNFYALVMPGEGEGGDPVDAGADPDGVGVRAFGLDVAEQDGTLHYVGSVYSQENRAVYDGISRDGVRLVTLAPVLKNHVFPLPEILQTFLKMGERGVSKPVELEFAVNLSVPPGERKDFVLLQMRPLVLNQELEDLDIDDTPTRDLVCRSDTVLGIGRMDDIEDVVLVDPDRFDRSSTRDIAAEVGRFNSVLLRRKRPYLLVGLGRWGSNDPWLGIPVSWEQINGARVIVETGFNDMDVKPSQGAHFFHNITSMRIGYFTVNPNSGRGHLDWDWLRSQPEEGRGEYVTHLRLEKPLVVKMNSHRNRGVILKPGTERTAAPFEADEFKEDSV